MDFVNFSLGKNVYVKVKKDFFHAQLSAIQSIAIEIKEKNEVLLNKQG
jgi:hypothetical protein